MPNQRIETKSNENKTKDNPLTSTAFSAGSTLKQDSELQEILRARDLAVQTLTARLDAARAAIAERDRVINAIYNSTSWRITAPFRSMSMRTASIIHITRRCLNIPASICDRMSARLIAVIFPYIQRYVPRKVKAIIPKAIREFGRSIIDSNQRMEQRLLRKIIYVVNHADKTTQRYRVFNYAAEFIRHGIDCTVIIEDQLRPEDVANASIVIFNRIAWSDRLGNVFELLRGRKIPTVFDIDDLVFDPERKDLLRSLSAKIPEDRMSFLEGMSRWKRMLLESDFVTVSTFALRQEVQKLGKSAFVIPNIIGRDIGILAEQIISARKLHNTDVVKIAYFSGSRTHEADFSVCKTALYRLLEEHQNAWLYIVGELESTVEFTEFDQRFFKVPLLEYDEMIRFMSSIDIVVAPLELNNAFTDCKSELKIFEPALFSIPCVVSPTSTFAAVIDHRRNGMLAATEDDWQKALAELVTDRNLRAHLGCEANRTIVRRYSASTGMQEAKSVYQAAINGLIPLKYPVNELPNDLKLAKPAISVIAILYSKENEIRYFLESLRRQNINENFEVILINDFTPDKSVEVVEQYLLWMKYYSNGRMNVTILNNDRNLGNCASRNIGIRHAKSDILVIVDADCVFDPDFLSRHLAAHASGYCDVAVGPRGIETGNQDPLSYLGCLENDYERVRKESRLQDPINPDSFVNCVTRNFSIRRSLASELLFDDAFSYSISPESGFGWEDIDLGYRLYELGARIWYLPNTISLHVSHSSVVGNTAKSLRSLRNFRRLHEKHQYLMLESRQWTIRTYDNIVKWTKAEKAPLDHNDDFAYLNAKFQPLAKIPRIALPVKPLRVLTHRWHVSHQYELYKLGHRFNLVRGAGTQMCDSWSWDIRPMPANARFVPLDSVKTDDYDLIILHFDENLIHPERCHNKVPLDWGKTFFSLLEFRSELPIIAICHGTPQFRGQYDPAYGEDDLGVVDEDARKEIVNLLQGITVVCNSHQAKKEWGFSTSQVIWHGFSPHDFPAGRHDRKVGLMLERAMLNRPHYNGYFIYKDVKARLENPDFSCLNVPNPEDSLPKEVEWATVKFHNYVRELGRFSIYFNPTKRSPMPRLRGEAMMTGAVTVNLNNHDVEMFIENGVNGFFGNEPEELAGQIDFLIKNPDITEKMGKRSRLTALDIFNHDRYLADWAKLINEVTNH